MQDLASLPRLSRSLSSSESTPSSSPKEGILDMRAGTLKVEFPSDDGFKKQQGKHPLVRTLNLDNTPFQIPLLFLLLMARIVVTTHGASSRFRNYHRRRRQHPIQTPFARQQHLLLLSRIAQLMPRNACMHDTALIRREIGPHRWNFALRRGHWDHHLTPA